ncbi:DUF2238 domain-containing protein [Ectobacillus sp. SYSU M60031]|uniref:DUF2238 domain-containing protein n=1 Tax=Ectobacillus ponti TaxID=2961894 RepID=A0AA42BNP8_9BACI|nr:DUF2238 domain-containing protein [Ectobacillus ponti]MCP8967917.1 DUF2238 domain-containing protein [Ectobacillus ponti]
MGIVLVGISVLTYRTFLFSTLTYTFIYLHMLILLVGGPIAKMMTDGTFTASWTILPTPNLPEKCTAQTHHRIAQKLLRIRTNSNILI